MSCLPHGPCRFAPQCAGPPWNRTALAVDWTWVSALESLRPVVAGGPGPTAGCLWRFDRVLHGARYYRLLAVVQDSALDLARVVVPLRNASIAPAPRARAEQSGLDALASMSRAWEAMQTELVQAAHTTGTMGTIATNEALNWHSLAGQPISLLLESSNNASIPSHALPSTAYTGLPHFFARTTRTAVTVDESSLQLTLVAVGARVDGQVNVELRWRPVGDTEWRVEPLVRAGGSTRGVFVGAVPFSIAYRSLPSVPRRAPGFHGDAARQATTVEDCAAGSSTPPAFEWFANATWSDGKVTLYAPPEAADGQYAVVSVLSAQSTDFD